MTADEGRVAEYYEDEETGFGSDDDLSFALQEDERERVTSSGGVKTLTEAQRLLLPFDPERRKFIAVHFERVDGAETFLKKHILPLRDAGKLDVVDAVVVWVSGRTRRTHFRSLYDVEQNRMSHAVKTGLGIGALYGCLTPIFLPVVAALGAASGAYVAHSERQAEEQELRADQNCVNVREVLKQRGGSAVLLWWKQAKMLDVATELLGAGGQVLFTRFVLPERRVALQATLDGRPEGVEWVRNYLAGVRQELDKPIVSDNPNSIARRLGYLPPLPPRQDNDNDNDNDNNNNDNDNNTQAKKQDKYWAEL